MREAEAPQLHPDLHLDVQARIGTAILTVGHLFELDTGDIIQLARPEGEHLDLLVGGALVGRAEILARGDSAAIRISELREQE